MVGCPPPTVKLDTNALMFILQVTLVLMEIYIYIYIIYKIFSDIPLPKEYMSENPALMLFLVSSTTK